MRLALALPFLIAPMLALMLAASPASAGPPGTKVMPTKHAYGALVDRLDSAIEAAGMFAVTRASASVGARGRGIKIAGNMVIGVYRNDFAVRMLEASVESGIEAPIRFYITENPDGTATLRYRAPSSVFAPYDGGAKLEAMARELDTIFAKIAKQAAGG